MHHLDNDTMERICFFSFSQGGVMRFLPAAAIGDLSINESRLLKTTVQSQCDSLWPFKSILFHIGPTCSEDLINHIVLSTQLEKLVGELSEPNPHNRSSDATLVNEVRAIALAHVVRIRHMRIATPPTTAIDNLVTQPSELDWLKVVTLITTNPEAYHVTERVQCLEGMHYNISGPLRFEDREHGLREYLYSRFTDVFIRVRLSPPQHHCPPMMLSITEDVAARWLDRVKETSSSDVGLLTRQQTEISDSPSQAVREPCSDPDNYERNRWLYEQRKAGRTNKQILQELDRIAHERDFAPLKSQNALRTAIGSYAEYERLPKIDGQRGRPRTNSRQATKRKSNGE
jgi:hypothetical protein